MDNQIILWLNSFAGKSAFLDSFGVSMAQNLIYVVAGMAVGFWLFKDRNFKTNLWVSLSSVIVSRLIIVEPLKILFDRQRPFEVLSLHKLIVDEGTGKSFPSGHAAILFSIAFAFYGTKWFWTLFALAVLSSVARIFVGVHYPSDILVGAIIGAATSLILLRLFKNRILS